MFLFLIYIHYCVCSALCQRHFTLLISSLMCYRESVRSLRACRRPKHVRSAPHWIQITVAAAARLCQAQRWPAKRYASCGEPGRSIRVEEAGSVSSRLPAPGTVTGVCVGPCLCICGRDVNETLVSQTETFEKCLQTETTLFWTVFSFCIVCIFNLSSVTYFPAWTNVNGTV